MGRSPWVVSKLGSTNKYEQKYFQRPHSSVCVCVCVCACVCVCVCISSCRLGVCLGIFMYFCLCIS